MEVDVIRSRKRRKTVEAHIVDGRMKLAIPSWMSKAEERHWIEVMGRRLRADRDAAEIDLPARAVALADRYGLPRPASIRFVTNQNQRWGSCTPDDGTIRISNRLARYPDWVLDYVIVHELAHLVELNHNAAFHALVDRYPRAERARGYLIAKSTDTGDHANDKANDNDAHEGDRSEGEDPVEDADDDVLADGDSEIPVVGVEVIDLTATDTPDGAELFDGVT